MAVLFDGHGILLHGEVAEIATLEQHVVEFFRRVQGMEVLPFRNQGHANALEPAGMDEVATSNKGDTCGQRGNWNSRRIRRLRHQSVAGYLAV